MSPLALNPLTLNPLTLNPLTLNPLALNPLTLKPLGDDLWLALHSDHHYFSTTLQLPTESPYQRPQTHQLNEPTDEPQRRAGADQTRDERVAELEQITSTCVTSCGKLFKHWNNDQYKAVCSAFQFSALKGTLGNAMQRQVRYQRIVEAVRSELYGAAVLAQVHIVAHKDILSRRTQQRRADLSFAALDRNQNTRQRIVHRADPDADDAERQRDREARRSRADAKCAKPLVLSPCSAYLPSTLILTL